MSPKVSVIVVNYHSRRYLTKLLASLRNGSFTDYEVIIIDNDRINVGYGAAINIGAQTALGKYLFIVNPDTQAFFHTLEQLVSFLDAHPAAGVVAPLLLNSQKKVYPLQGTRALTPLTAIFALSVINKYWPSNPVSRHYWLADWNKSYPQQVGVAPGTAFLVRRKVFEQVNGFDPAFFLYFEESDFCRRVSSLGWEIYINPSSKLIHHWGRSTPQSPHIAQIFSESRRYYFTKHYGPLWSAIVSLVVQ